MLTTVSPPCDLTALAAERNKLQRASLSPRTEQAYNYEFGQFAKWCALIGRAALPASEDTLALYLTHRVTQGHKVSGAVLAAVSVAYKHRVSRLPSPYTEAIHHLLRGAQRVRAERPRQMRPLTLADLRQMSRELLRENTVFSLRDRAILLLGFATALRRSNLVDLTLADLTFGAEGLSVYVRREKQDRAGKGRLIAVPFGQHRTTCAVRATEAWLRERGREPGPLFIRLDHTRGRLLPITGDRVWQIVKAAAERIKLDPENYGPHSLRAGFITAAGTAGVGHLLIASQSGHRSLDSLQRYFRPIEAFRTNACTTLGL